MKNTDMDTSKLMEYISKNLNDICIDNEITNATMVEIVVNPKTHLDEKQLLEYLLDMKEKFVDRYTEIKINFKDITGDLAIITEVNGISMKIKNRV